jgi:diguanylate cyclase (GGDEF)-like protein
VDPRVTAEPARPARKPAMCRPPQPPRSGSSLTSEATLIISAALLAACVQVLSGTGSRLSHATFGGLELCASIWASIASVGAARRLRADHTHRTLRLSWLLLAMSFAAWSCGQAVFAVQDVLGLSAPVTNWSDAPFALHTALFIISALTQVVSSSRRHVGWRTAADGALLALSILTLNWVGWLAPTIANYRGDRLDLLIPLAYPIADLVGLTLLVTTLTLAGWTRTGGFLLAGAVLMTAAVSAYTYSLVTGRGFATGGLPDFGWLLAFSFFALAARHGAHAATLTPARPESTVVLYLPYLVVVPAAAVAGAHLLRGPDPVGVILVMALFAITLARQLVVLVDHRALLGLAEAQGAQLEHLAHVDPLTGLQNRRRFTQHLQEAVTQVLSRHGNTVVAFIDLDRFKVVNDTLGHGAGDELLVQVADRLRTCLRPQDHCARWGGDEFACLLSTDDISGAALADRLQQALEGSITLAGHEVMIKVSIGVVDLSDVVHGPLLAHDHSPLGSPHGSTHESAGDSACNSVGDSACNTVGDSARNTAGDLARSQPQVVPLQELITDLLTRADENMYAVKRERHEALRAQDSQDVKRV